MMTVSVGFDSDRKKSAACPLPLRFWLMLLIFLWLPLFGWWVVFHSWLTDEAAAEQARAQRHLEAVLDEAAPYDDAELFWSRVFRRLDARARQASDPIASLKTGTERLRRWFAAGGFELVVWNSDGRVGYDDGTIGVTREEWEDLWAELLGVLRLTNREVRNRRKFVLLLAWTKVFGSGVMTARKVRFWRETQELLTPVGGRNTPGLWWQFRRGFSYVVRVKYAGRVEPVGLRYFQQVFPRRRFADTRFGFVDRVNPRWSDALPEWRRELLGDDFRAGDILKQEYGHARWFLMVRRFPSGRVGYAARPKSWRLVHQTTLLTILGLVLLAAGFWVTRQCRRRWCGLDDRPLPLRWKLGFLFGFANGIPLLLLTLLGTSQLRHYELNLLNDLQQSCTEMMRLWNEGTMRHLEHTRSRTVQRLDRLAAKLRGRPFEERDFPDIAGISEDFILTASSTFDLIGPSGFFSGDRPDLKKATPAEMRQYRFIVEGIQQILHILNRTNDHSNKAEKFELIVEAMFSMKFDEFCNTLMTGLNRPFLWGEGERKILRIIHLLPCPITGVYQYLFSGAMNQNPLIIAYLKKTLPEMNKNRLGLRFFARSNVVMASQNTLPPASKRGRLKQDVVSRVMQLPSVPEFPPEILRFVYSLGSLVSVTPEPLWFRHRPYLVLGCRLSKLDPFHCFALYPYQRIERRLADRKKGLMAFGLLNLLLTFLFGQAIAKRFLEPIRVLHEGAKSIVQREFSRRLPDLGSDEFGRIAQAFNLAAESLQDIAVARAVQENLLPQGDLSTPAFQVFGRSMSLSELGGDYYDVVSRPDGSRIFILGDVAGHGIPAGLLMAMAKAALFRMVQMQESLPVTLNGLNRLFHHLRRRKLHRAMTLQTIEVHDERSEVVLTNAGHCYAIHLHDGVPTLLKTVSTPIGISLKPRFGEVRFQMVPGDTLLMYTDGAAELTSPAGEPVGFERLAAWVAAASDPDPAVLYERLMKTLRGFAGNPRELQDDLTMLILVRRA